MLEPLLQQVARTDVIETERCETKENFKKKVREELEKMWTDKRMYGQYKRDLDKEVDMEKNMVVVKKRGLETRD